jgi:type IV secretory pathway TrbD component
MRSLLRTRLRRGLAFAGFAMAMLAVVSEDHRVGWGAIALLIASLLVRVLARRDPTVDEETKY